MIRIPMDLLDIRDLPPHCYLETPFTGIAYDDEPNGVVYEAEYWNGSCMELKLVEGRTGR